MDQVYRVVCLFYLHSVIYLIRTPRAHHSVRTNTVLPREKTPETHGVIFYCNVWKLRIYYHRPIISFTIISFNVSKPQYT